jgi:hydrogenase maturation protease
MSRELVDRIAEAVLYEGYILYPYRPSVKNRYRWTFGGLVPESYSLVQEGTEAWTMRTECLLAGSTGSRLRIRVRFLHPMMRQVGEATRPTNELRSERVPAFRPVESLRVDDNLHCTWQETVERTIDLDEASIEGLLAGIRLHRFSFPHWRASEWLRASTGEIAGIIVREQQSIEGAVELSANSVGDGVFKISVRVLNRTPFLDSGQASRDDAMMRSLVSTHTILTVREGEFVSLVDPPRKWGEIAAGCRNEGAWPVLVGEDGVRDTMLSAPIILGDYPRIAPESAGNFFDSTEIDEMLALRIMTLTDNEKQTMAAVNDRARALLQRTEAMSEDRFRGLHGTMRDLHELEVDHG